MTTATATRCQNCGVPLSGGIDTYGQFGQELCFSCLHSGEVPFTPAHIRENNQQVGREEFLQKLKAKLEFQFSGYEDDRDYAQQQMRILSERVFAIDKEIDGGKRCPEEPDGDV